MERAARDFCSDEATTGSGSAVWQAYDTPTFEDPVKVANEGLVMLRARALEPRLQQIELDLANHQVDSEIDPISLLIERSNIHRQLRQPLGLSVAV